MDPAVALSESRNDAYAQALRLRVLRATMRSVQHVANNFLCSVQLFCEECDGRVPAESVERLERRIREMSCQLKALGDLESVQECNMAAGPGIAYADTPADQQ